MSSRYRQRAPAPVSTGGGTDKAYDYNFATQIGQVRSTSPAEQAYQSLVRRDGPPPPPPSRPPPSQSSTPKSNGNVRSSVDGDDALLDLEQLEELHQEAEKMKALGNKHMAAQEYSRAYNAYSAALQLSPVGPSSHVFLSNRAAALLSLKRYAAAATDARRAVALAPTFGKAHARLGQSLYFLKEYEEAVAAYEEALAYEPDNAVTQTYLEKARRKLLRQREKIAGYGRNEDASLADESAGPFTATNSIATDPSARNAVVESGFRGMSKAIMDAVNRNRPVDVVDTDRTATNLVSPLADGGTEDEHDPDFDEAVRIQVLANKLLASKRYKEAIEQYSAALFLVPDDPFLSPELHLGRAHALNGARRHQSARNDALLAIKIQPTSEAYSTLAKSLFYMEDYFGAIEAFEQCMDLLPSGESLSMFDQAYLRKAEAAWDEEVRKNPDDARSTVSTRNASVPKLPPPRFVPREKAIISTPNMPPLPREWPQQSPLSPSNLKVGIERTVTFLSESLGIKLNRGYDGIVRVISVTPDVPGSPLVRNGQIAVGDVVREAAGVDIRRPITNIMWGDTVALIKMAPRPINLVVATEESAVPPFVAEEIRRAAEPQDEEEKTEEPEMYFEEPSPASGMESVKESAAMVGTVDTEQEVAHIEADVGDGEVNDTVDFGSAHEASSSLVDDNVTEWTMEEVVGPPELSAASDTTTFEDDDDAPSHATSQIATSSEHVRQVPFVAKSATNEEEQHLESDADIIEASETGNCTVAEKERRVVEGCSTDTKCDALEDDVTGQSTQEDFVVVAEEESLSPQEVEKRIIGGEIVFTSCSVSGVVDEWTNLSWLATSGTRKVRFCDVVMKLERKGLFWNGDQYSRRKLAIYETPSLILVLRPPKNAAEVRKLLDLPDGVEIAGGENTLDSFLVAENVIDPKTCKLRLSLLTTVTSVGNTSAETDDPRRKACFELVSPSDTITLSAFPPKNDEDVGNPQLWSTTSDIYLETAGLESAVSNALYHAHMPTNDSTLGLPADMAWRHQIIQGSLHSFVVTGDQDMLEKALKAAANASQCDNSEQMSSSKYLRPHVIDERDESGRTALHYACSRRSSSAVSSLIGAGANCSIPVGPAEFYPSHLSALMLDEKSLSTVLSASYPMRPDPNALDAFGRTPMYLAAVAGKAVGGGSDDMALARCLSALEAWGGQMLIDQFSGRLHHPVSYLASRWRPGAICAVLAHMSHRYTLQTSGMDPSSLMALGALFHYPIHASIVTLRKKIEMIGLGERGHGLKPNELSPDSVLVGTIRVLLENGFEPNERLDIVTGKFDGSNILMEYAGFSPLQILALAAIELDALPESVSSALKHTTSLLIARTAELLVRNGARLSLSAPSRTKLGRSTSGESASVTSEGSTSGNGVALSLDQSELKIDSNDKLVALLGGGERLTEAKKSWSQVKSVDSAGTFHIHQDKQTVTEAEYNSCSICWKAFGTIRNRKHRCRITNRYVCDECSSKRIVADSEEHRLSDGQFLLARVDAAMAEAARLEEAQERARIRQMRVKKIEDERASRQMAAEEEDKRNRDSLLGEVMEKAASYVFGEEDQQDTVQDQVGGLASKMNETRDALNQRGEKLNSLSEKTSNLRDSSAEFAKLAKELKNAQKGGLFW